MLFYTLRHHAICWFIVSCRVVSSHVMWCRFVSWMGREEWSFLVIDQSASSRRLQDSSDTHVEPQTGTHTLQEYSQSK